MYLIEKIVQLRKYFFFLDELFFLRKVKKYIILNKNKQKLALLIMRFDYFYFVHQFLLMNSNYFKNYSFDGIWITTIYCKKNTKFQKIIFKIRLLLDFCLYCKWKVMYKSIGVRNFIYINNDPNKINDIIKKNASEFLSTKALKNYYYKNIKAGDIIFDSYLRYYNKIFIDKNKKTEFQISQFFYVIQNINNKLKNKLKNYELLMPIQSSFLHAYPIRLFLDYKKKVVGGWNFSQYVKIFSKDDDLHHYKWENYKTNFSKVLNKNKAKIDAKKKLNHRLQGGIDETNYYMKKSSYGTNMKKLKKFDCVIFLPCFVDSPYAFGDIIFESYYDWIKSTLDFLKKANIKTAIKEHPNSLPASRKFIKKFKNNYLNKNFIWLDKDTPNNLIFNYKPKVCISIQGNIIIEVAYHNLNIICAGRNPFCSYDFVIKANSKEDYFKKIEECIFENYKQEINFDEIYQSFYMHYINNNDDVDSLSRKYDIKKFMIKYLNHSKLLKKIDFSNNSISINL